MGNISIDKHVRHTRQVRVVFGLSSLLFIGCISSLLLVGTGIFICYEKENKNISIKDQTNNNISCDDNSCQKNICVLISDVLERATNVISHPYYEHLIPKKQATKPIHSEADLCQLTE